jgi:hydrogenase maturation protease
MEPQIEVLVLGIGNVLWADEGFGVRAVEALHAAFEFPAGVELMDGGTLGLNLYEPVALARRVLVLDAIDFSLPPGTLRVLRGDEVPAWGRTKLSPHQTGFNDVLALAQLNGREPESIVAIGVQPVDLSDFGGSLTGPVRARLPEAVALAAQEIAAWGFAGHARAADVIVLPLNAPSLALGAYESGRPTEAEACRAGDPRILERRRMPGGSALAHDEPTSPAAEPR